MSTEKCYAPLKDNVGIRSIFWRLVRVVEGVPADRREKVWIPLKGIEGSPGLVPGLSLRSYFPMNPENLTFYVYILKSCMDGSYYIGQCHDLDKRMSTHADGLSKYTSSKRPLRLVYFEAFPSRSHAIKREKQIKSKRAGSILNS